MIVEALVAFSFLIPNTLSEKKYHRTSLTSECLKIFLFRNQQKHFTISKPQKVLHDDSSTFLYIRLATIDITQLKTLPT